MASNPAKPNNFVFKTRSLWNSCTKETVQPGDEVELEEAKKYLEKHDEGKSFTLNDGRTNYSSHPQTLEIDEISDILEELERKYDDVVGYSEVYESELGYDVFISLAPGNNGDGEINYSRKEGVKIKGTTGKEPSWI